MNQSHVEHCCECGTQMMLTSMFSTHEAATGQLRGTLQCNHCKRYYCFDCSDADMPCFCGDRSWQEKVYYPREPDPAFLIDETGEALPFFPHLYLSLAEVRLPENVPPRELNIYLKKRIQASKSNFVRVMILPAIMVGLAAAAVISAAYEPGPLAIGGGVCIGLVSMPILFYIAAGKTLFRDGIAFSCRECRQHITIERRNPSSAWLCSNCGQFNHFLYWKRTWYLKQPQQMRHRS